MNKDKSNRQKRKAHTPEKVEQTGNPYSDENQNQGHNAKKMSLGPNTKR